jgi:tellurite resistance protein TerC
MPKTKIKEHFAITTLKQARRVIKIVVGFTIVLLGGIMLLLPGPGVVTIIVGLALLGTEFVWAKKLLKRFGKEANNVKNTIFNNTPKT